MTETVSSPRQYYLTFAALLVLLVVTVGIARLDFGPFNVAVALMVAATKTVLIAVYFMHLRTAHATVRVFSLIGLLWLVILMLLMLSDYATRITVGPPTF